MALTLTANKSSSLESFRKNRWIMQFTTIPGGLSSPEETLAFAAHTAQRPTVTFNTTEYQRLNERFWVAGKPTWSDLAMSFFDYINMASTGVSASQILYNWANSIYSPITGGMGFKKDYSTTGTLALLDPAGGIAQVWNLFYVWPSSVNYGDLSADDDGLCEVSVTFKYDYAVKATETQTA